jgi:hypothetical protein
MFFGFQTWDWRNVCGQYHADDMTIDWGQEPKYDLYKNRIGDELGKIDRSWQFNFWTMSNIYIYIHTYIRTYVRTYLHTYMHAHIHTCMHAYIHTYIRLNYITLHDMTWHDITYIHAYIHTYIWYIDQFWNNTPYAQLGICHGWFWAVHPLRLTRRTLEHWPSS